MNTIDVIASVILGLIVALVFFACLWVIILGLAHLLKAADPKASASKITRILFGVWCLWQIAATWGAIGAYMDLRAGIPRSAKAFGWFGTIAFGMTAAWAFGWFKPSHHTQRKDLPQREGSDF